MKFYINIIKQLSALEQQLPLFGYLKLNKIHLPTMSKSRLETPSQNKGGRNWLQPPGLANPADSRVLQDPYSPRKLDYLLNPGQQDLIREMNKVRKDITESRQRLDPPNYQLNQSKSTESLGTKHRLQFIQQKFKEKDELLLFQQTVIENLKKDMKHRDDVINTIRERQNLEDGKIKNSRQDAGLFKHLKESRADKAIQLESPIMKKSRMLSFIQDNLPDNSPIHNPVVSPYGQYNIRVFSSEELLSNLIGETQQQPTKQPDTKGENIRIDEFKIKLEKLTKDYETLKAEYKINEANLNKVIQEKTAENTRLSKEYNFLEHKQRAGRQQLQKVKSELEGLTKILALEKSQHQQAIKKTKEFDSVQRSLRGALLAKENQIKQLTNEVNILKLTAKCVSSGKTTVDHEINSKLEATRIQLISKQLQLRDVQKTCKKLEAQLSAARKDLQDYLINKSRASSISSKSPIKVEEPTTSKVLDTRYTHDQSTETLNSKPAEPKKRKNPTKPRNRHACCSPETTVSRSKSFTYYPVIKWNRVANN